MREHHGRPCQAASRSQPSLGNTTVAGGGKASLAEEIVAQEAPVELQPSEAVLVAGSGGGACARVAMLDATGWAFGFGHHFLMLSIAVDVAFKAGVQVLPPPPPRLLTASTPVIHSTAALSPLQLVVDDDLWEGRGRGTSSASAGRGSYDWAWQLFPFRKASSVPACAALRDGADAAAVRAERERPHSVAEAFGAARAACGSCTRIQVGLGGSCDGE